MKRVYVIISIFIIILLGSAFGLYKYNGKKVVEESVVIGNLYNSSIEIEDYEGNSIKIEDKNTLEKLKGANPRMKFWYQGVEVAYIDHLGDIYSQNITVVDTGFFTWIGNSANRITKGWFANIEVTGTINTSFINTTNIQSDDWTNTTIAESQITDLDKYTKTEGDTNLSLYTTTPNADIAFINASGDSMSGNLNFTDNNVSGLDFVKFTNGGYAYDNGTSLVLGHS